MNFFSVSLLHCYLEMHLNPTDVLGRPITVLGLDVTIHLRDP